MIFTRDISYEITKIQLSYPVANEEFKQKILNIAPDYKKKYLEPWHKDAHKWINGKQDTSKGPGTDSFIGFLDAAKEMNYDIDLVIQATEKWHKNHKREKAIQSWLKENHIKNTVKIIYPDEIEDNDLFEGTKKEIIVNAYERSSQARQECINHYGYNCQICNFDFEKVYGKIGKDFIHIHHIVDISTISESYKVNPIKDLIPVCPNCHAMLHKKRPAYSIKEMKNFIDKTDL